MLYDKHYGVNHEFYCEELPKWENWNREWALVGVMPGWAALTLYNDVIGRVKGSEKKSEARPFGIWVFLVPMGVALGAVVLAVGSVAVLLALIYGALISLCTRSRKPLVDVIEMVFGRRVAAQTDMRMERMNRAGIAGAAGGSGSQVDGADQAGAQDAAVHGPLVGPVDDEDEIAQTAASHAGGPDTRLKETGAPPPYAP